MSCLSLGRRLFLFFNVKDGSYLAIQVFFFCLQPDQGRCALKGLYYVIGQRLVLPLQILRIIICSFFVVVFLFLLYPHIYPTCPQNINLLQKHYALQFHLYKNACLICTLPDLCTVCMRAYTQLSGMSCYEYTNKDVHKKEGIFSIFLFFLLY